MKKYCLIAVSLLHDLFNGVLGISDYIVPNDRTTVTNEFYEKLVKGKYSRKFPWMNSLKSQKTFSQKIICAGSISNQGPPKWKSGASHLSQLSL